MDAPEVANYVLRVVDTILKEKPNYTGTISIELNCNCGGIGHIGAKEVKKIRVNK